MQSCVQKRKRDEKSQEVEEDKNKYDRNQNVYCFIVYRKLHNNSIASKTYI